MVGKEIKRIVLKDVKPSDIRDTLDRMSVLVDPVSGIVRSIIPNRLETGDPQIFAFGALTPQVSFSASTMRPFIIRSGGAAVERDKAIAATIGEAAERYCAAHADPDDFIYASYDELEEEAVDPPDFSLYSARQYQQPGFPFQPFTRESKVTWTWGYSLIKEKPVLIPISQTYLLQEQPVPVRVSRTNEPFAAHDRVEQKDTKISDATSTGLACGNTIEEAILSAIGEIIERDALACFWLGKQPARGVVIDEGSAIFETFNEKLALRGLQYYVCDITTDLGLPVIFTLLVGGSNDGIMVNAGSQANLSPTRAAMKSVVEAAHGRPYVRFILQTDTTWHYRPDFLNVNSFLSHAAFYTRSPQHHDALDFIKNPISVRNLSDMRDLSTGSILGDLNVYLKALSEFGFDVIVKDLTTPDIEDVGLKIVRVLIPGLQLLHGDHRYPFLGCPRLYRMGKSLGFSEHVIGEDNLNPYPHPLP